ncbi:endonuclease/exonuclease/phosphatase family protein [Gordonia insulae]|uniref:endonuclease/exonuclease/phosphatase family protein n=1 Tax=Gordonia insulae TaxID=2420509 RepID=UPI001E28ADB9|nr:endonuclease/exonuclease/phosphatase family protein [Gordonia insulae]
MGRFLRFLAVFVGCALLAGAGVAIWLHHHDSQGEIALYLTTAVPFAVIAGALAVVIFAATRRWILLALSVVVTLGVVYTQIPLWRAQAAPAGQPITIVSANILFGGADIDALARQVADADADLLSVQEVTPEALARLRAGSIARQLPYEYAVPGPVSAGTALFSRTPLRGQTQVDGTVLRNLEAQTDLAGAAGTRVLALHPGAPLRGRSQVWKDDIDSIRDHLSGLPPGPAIAAGDFNATWDQARYRALLQNGFADATDQAGAGFVATWPTDRPGGAPVIAIDHVITRGFVATSIRTFDLPGSDHRGVVVSLVAS